MNTCQRCNAIQGVDPEVTLVTCTGCQRTVCTLCVMSDSDQPCRCVECEKVQAARTFTYTDEDGQSHQARRIDWNKIFDDGDEQREADQRRNITHQCADGSWW